MQVVIFLAVSIATHLVSRRGIRGLDRDRCVASIGDSVPGAVLETGLELPVLG